jgi:D-tyrosyl-tRNA(Tyr) deacylase
MAFSGKKLQFCFMRAVIQRVSTASVTIHGEMKSAISTGFMVLLGIETEDNKEDADWLCGKIAQLRVFSDENGMMNKSLQDVDGEVLVVSQFTLHASYKKGNRPSFIKAARPEQAIPLYEHFVSTLGNLTGKPVATGTFGADMKVALVNDGPVTIIMDTRNKE